MDLPLETWCRARLGSAPVETFFRADHLSHVRGVRLEDGRVVALKVRAGGPRLVACARVQRAMAQGGIRCPQPLVEPAPLEERSSLWVSAEEWLPGGGGYGGDDRAAAYARLLARIVRAAPAPAAAGPLEPPVPWLWYAHDDPVRTWPPPAGARWDPHRSSAGVPDRLAEVARRARARLLADDARTLPPVVGHGDLSDINVRWDADAPDTPERAVVHDWDSVVALPEAVLAGAAAADHVSDDRCRLASVDEGERFLDVYASIAGRAWTATEREAAWAAGAWVGAYNAAFEHLKGAAGPVSGQLALDAVERLRRAGA